MPLAKHFLFLLTLVILGLTTITESVHASFVRGPNTPQGKIVVANRGSGDLSVINVKDDTTVLVPMPTGTNPPEPMYVVYARAGKQVFVGDRANDRVVAFDSRTFAVQGMIPAGDGVFHMWIDPSDRQLWVNNDVDNTTTVIDARNLVALATVPMPADLVAMGGKPHDVVLDRRFAYVTMVGFPDENDYVIKYDQRTFAEVGRAAVGKDPHVSLTLRNQFLYVPCQNSDAVFVLDRNTMQEVSQLAIPAAHGAGMSTNGRRLYTTNIAGGGSEGLWTIDTRHNQVIGGGVDTPFATPHNIALTQRMNKLYITHSGATANQVSVYQLTRPDGVPVHLTDVIVGTNPFGLAFVR